jgi:hypothetical protein
VYSGHRISVRIGGVLGDCTVECLLLQEAQVRCASLASWQREGRVYSPRWRVQVTQGLRRRRRWQFKRPIGWRTWQQCYTLTSPRCKLGCCCCLCSKRSLGYPGVDDVHHALDLVRVENCNEQNVTVARLNQEIWFAKVGREGVGGAAGEGCHSYQRAARARQEQRCRPCTSGAGGGRRERRRRQFDTMQQQQQQQQQQLK